MAGRPKIKLDLSNGMQGFVCTKCAENKPLSMFSKDKRAKSGYQSACKVCQSNYYKENKESYQLLKNGNKKYGEKMKEYFIKKREKINEYKRSRYNTDEGRLKVLSGNYKRKNKTRETNDGTVTAEALIQKLLAQEYKCAITGEHLYKYHIDHIIPLNKGGKHTISNIQFVLPEINMSKKDNLEYATK